MNNLKQLLCLNIFIFLSVSATVVSASSSSITLHAGDILLQPLHCWSCNLIEAQTILGIMYEKGEGVTENHKEAIKWYQLAAEKGDADAQYKLGLMYSNGEGVLQDNKEAAKWFQLAVEKGNILAKGELDKLTREKSLWNRIKDIF